MPQLRAGGWREVSGDRDTCGHVTQVTTSGLSTRVIGAQADQVTIRLLKRKWDFIIAVSCSVVSNVMCVARSSIQIIASWFMSMNK